MIPHGSENAITTTTKTTSTDSETRAKNNGCVLLWSDNDDDWPVLLLLLMCVELILGARFGDVAMPDNDNKRVDAPCERGSRRRRIIAGTRKSG